MYKFNFLNKINQERIEVKKRNRFVKMIFFISAATLVCILLIIFLLGMTIGSDHAESLKTQKNINSKITEFRNKDFFKYKTIEDVYNAVNKRRKISALLNSVEQTLDSNIIISHFALSNENTEIKFVTRTSASKSQVMTDANNLKNSLTDKLVKLKMIDEKVPIKLIKGPDLDKSFEEYQYWTFDFLIKFEKQSPPVVKPAKTSKPG